MTPIIPTFSIIIPSYNYAHYLPKTIDSVLNQTDKDFELIVINDGSSDNTEELMKVITAEHPDTIRFYSQENHGVPFTRNRGEKLTNGRFLLFLDSDDILLPEALSIFKNEIEQHPEIDCFIAQYYSVNESGHRKKRCLWTLSDSREQNFKDYVTNPNRTMLCSSTLFKKSIFDKLQFPEHIPQSEDESLFAHIFANYNCMKVESFTSEIIKHSDSLRGRYDPALHDLPERLCRQLFDSEKIPTQFMTYEGKYRALKHLDQFRTFYINDLYEQAIKEYKIAFNLDKRESLKLNFLRKAIKAYFK